MPKLQNCIETIFPSASFIYIHIVVFRLFVAVFVIRILGKQDFEKVRFWESGILRKLDFENVEFGTSGILGKLSFWKKLVFGTLGFYNFWKTGF